MKKKREYIDADHEIMMEYYEVLELNPKASTQFIKMQHFIVKDPYFFDPYIVIYDLYKEQGKEEEAQDILDSGYKLALKRILDKKGNFPDELEWGWMENRHIIRIILNKGLSLWEQDNNKEALSIFRNLLNSNPNDNAGVRFYLLAILEDMSRDKYAELYENEGYLSNDIFEWFEKGSKKYKEEFSTRFLWFFQIKLQLFSFPSKFKLF